MDNARKAATLDLCTSGGDQVAASCCRIVGGSSQVSQIVHLSHSVLWHRGCPIALEWADPDLEEKDNPMMEK